MPSQSFQPDDLLHFIEMEGFWQDWLDLGLGDDELLELQLTIMAGGKYAPLIPGTGGLRKLRFSRQAGGWAKAAHCESALRTLSSTASFCSWLCTQSVNVMIFP